jgi:hypothetical protein
MVFGCSLACYRHTKLDRLLKNLFYLPHNMDYEGSIGFVSRKMKKIIADFHVLGIFMAKKHDLRKKSACHAPLNAKFVSRI